MATTPWEDPLARAIATEFGERVQEFSSYLGQDFLVVHAAAVVPVLDYLKLEHDFDFLVDITAVDYPDREERFELIYLVHCFTQNRRVRLKTRIPDGFQPQSAVSVYLGANWLEREVFDMFGIEFAGHPNLKRILLPDEWTGHPLRKDYSILGMDQRWVQENLGIESGQ